MIKARLDRDGNYQVVAISLSQYRSLRKKFNTVFANMGIRAKKTFYQGRKIYEIRVNQDGNLLNQLNRKEFWSIVRDWTNVPPENIVTTQARILLRLIGADI